jgi:uncharacterized protein (TIGR00255 family)
MTGFGSGEVQSSKGTVRAEVRAVNHRSLDIRVRAPSDLSDFAAACEEAVRATCYRGRIEVTLRLSKMETETSGTSLAALRLAFDRLAILRDEVAPGSAIPLDAVVRLAAHLGTTPSFDTDEVSAAIRHALQIALDGLTAMRATEGVALMRDLRARAATLADEARRVDGDRPAILAAMQERVVARVRRLLEGTDVQTDPARLAQEVAWLAERSDVAEELTRLSSHLDQFEACLANCEGTGIGRKLEFLVQEMGREVNTLGSKVQDAGTARRVVEMKAELDRIREQVANVL